MFKIDVQLLFGLKFDDNRKMEVIIKACSLVYYPLDTPTTFRAGSTEVVRQWFDSRPKLGVKTLDKTMEWQFTIEIVFPDISSN